ncbi:MAG: DHA2 family efflux MFS transporter permease subunit [Candidatus Tectomicrobia bacterium]|nr:DHA2 family efflux MFS transporter permease subunit [Candidatus Tectomicrobia bacterium]
MARSTLISKESEYYKWWLAAAIWFGSLSMSFSIRMTNIAIPRMMSFFQVDIDTMQWVQTSGAITRAIVPSLAGWLGGMIGAQRLYVWSILFRTVSSFFQGSAWSFSSLLFFRVLGSLGGGLRQPLSMAMLFEAFPPHQRGFAMGLYQSSWTLGPLIAPVIGGYLVDYFGWRSVFYIDVPLGVMTFLMTAMVLGGAEEGRAKPSLDFVGLLSMAAGLVAFIMAVSDGREYGWSSQYILTLFTTSIVALLVFLFHELRTPEPIVDLRLFKSFDFTVSSVVQSMNQAIFMSMQFVWTVFAQRVMGYSPKSAGLLETPAAVASSASGVVSGWLTDRIDPRIIITVGLASASFVQWKLSFLTPEAGVGAVVLLVIGMNFCRFLTSAPLTTVAMSRLPENQLLMGTGLLSLTQGLGGTTGMAASASYVASRQDFYNMAYSQAQPIKGETPRLARQIAGEFTRGGLSEQTAMGQAYAMLRRQIALEATLSAYQDLFRMISIMGLIVIAPVLFLRINRTTALKQKGRGRRRAESLA